MEVYLGRYLVSRDGTMFSITKDGLRPKKHFITERGYARQELLGKKREYVHRIVAKAYLHTDGKKDQVDHINGNKLDNRVENLRWCTRSENMAFYLSSDKKAATTNSPKKIVGICVESQKETVFDSLHKAAALTGAKTTSIRACLKGCMKTSGGYYWRLYT